MIQRSQITVRSTNAVNDALAEALNNQTLDELERTIQLGLQLAIENDRTWQDLSRSVRDVFRRHDHVIISDLCPEGDGRSLIAVMNILGSQFLPYGGSRIVKFLAMSPWSQDLARTGREGFFHTDLNASPSPPALTGIQCITPDPGAPEFGHNRIARIGDLLEHLTKNGDHPALHFLINEDVEMANDRSADTWRGRALERGVLRFHPETIRAACRRRGRQAPESILNVVQEAALSVSKPVSLDRGEILLFSNHRTLHYRSECSVQFNHFPMDFEARKVHILHSLHERPNV